MNTANALPTPESARAGPSQPNEFDRHRIVRALERRARYRYVSPSVEMAADGYRIVSPCCSRNIDSSGGLIDIARLEYRAASGEWHLYSKDHDRQTWQLRASACRLDALLAQLNEDRERVFWQ